MQKLKEIPGQVSRPLWDPEETCSPCPPSIKTIGEFREYTKNLPDDAPFTIEAPTGVFEEKIPTRNYKMYTSGDFGGVDIKASRTEKPGVCVQFVPHHWH